MVTGWAANKARRGPLRWEESTGRSYANGGEKVAGEGGEDEGAVGVGGAGDLAEEMEYEAQRRAIMEKKQVHLAEKMQTGRGCGGGQGRGLGGMHGRGRGGGAMLMLAGITSGVNVFKR